jgi:3-methyladenine DNA glycosylase AlkC
MAAEAKGGAAPAKKTKAQTLRLIQDPNVAVGRFATSVQVSAHDEHFVLSFMTVDPLEKDGQDQGMAYLAARVYMAPEHVRRLSAVLTKQVQSWDQANKKKQQE